MKNKLHWRRIQRPHCHSLIRNILFRLSLMLHISIYEILEFALIHTVEILCTVFKIEAATLPIQPL